MNRDASWVDGRTGQVLGDAALTDRLAASDVVLIGEQHAEPLSMAVHVAVLEAAARLARPVVVAVEWLPGSARLAVKGWLSSDEPVESLGDAVGWDRVWGHELTAYAPVLEAARRLGCEVVPVNAEPGLARLVARGGVAGVPDERRAELPPLDTANERHRAWFFDVMREMAAHHPAAGAHGQGGDEALERMYLAQLVWDETMSGRVAALAGAPTLVVVMAGQGHIGRGYGVPERLPERLSRLVVLPASDLDEARSRASGAPFPDREADLFAVPRR